MRFDLQLSGRFHRRDLSGLVAAVLSQRGIMPGAYLSEVEHEEDCALPRGAAWCRCKKITVVVHDEETPRA